ncbi:aminotransferase class I/II-fold pyridoxal phosphate-dependent enzyme [Solitalea sp. MAHUQ-68]|uniref:Aminotransferase class I/II-fold pyridoxal phosphate-dependent enzyme n=1 Tax=Solitalea agri TaxID=2953739 RepID=A0A9X2F0N4_9SPHI|nr:GntG family PLP-dependent aldolase [Solitalea agri]MCO4291949.1 aminotransferase class I/II-fold pyridoxal phosphate-dependent enzyme [Solitalea agri]
MLIDLRSDTITKPTPKMLEEMMSPPVGDDVYGEDPTVKKLETKTAELFGKEAALFCPSGTMTNQIAIKCFTNPLEEVVCDEGAHVYYYEGGGIAFNSSASTRTLKGKRGIFTADQLIANINKNDIHNPTTSLVVIENTANRGGGKCWDLSEIESIAKVCKEHGLYLHLDGARIFNATVAKGYSPMQVGSYFDGISVCLSKGLGAPIGSVLLGTKPFIEKAKRVRKVMGGGWRQAGYLAAAGIYALDHHIDRLVEDHQRAKTIETALTKCSFVKSVVPVETNIVIFELIDSVSEAGFIQKMKEQNILCASPGKQHIRFVTHLDFTDAMLDSLVGKLKSFNN